MPSRSPAHRIEAIINAMSESWPARIVRDDGTELVIHAMPMRAKYRRLLQGE